MQRIARTDRSRAQHRVLVERIVSMQGTMKKSLRSDHPHVRRALTLIRDEERALRAKLHPGSPISSGEEI